MDERGIAVRGKPEIDPIADDRRRGPVERIIDRGRRNRDDASPNRGAVGAVERVEIAVGGRHVDDRRDTPRTVRLGHDGRRGDDPGRGAREHGLETEHRFQRTCPLASSTA